MDNSRIVSGKEIDLVELTKSVWDGRQLILKTVGISLIIGLVIAFTSPVEYRATSKLLPEIADGTGNDLGKLGGLASLAGVNLGGMNNSMNNLSPQLYPEIAKSLPFLLDVMHDTVYFEKMMIYSSAFNYFENVARPSLFDLVGRYTLGLPGMLKELFANKQEIGIVTNDDDFYRLSKRQWNIIEDFKDRIVVSISDETGLITISVEMPDPYAAAQVAQKVENMITRSVVKYKTDKAKENLSFVVARFQEAKNDFERIQLRLAKVQDRNKNVTSAKAQIEVRRIENEYNVAFEVYKSLASQVEQAKIKLKEDTPVFTVLEPVRVPEEKSKPKRSMVVLAVAILGLIGSSSVKIVQYVYNYQ